MKKILLAIILGFIAPVRAADYQTGTIGPFGGLNNSDSSLIISANQAQDLLNVDIEAGGKSIKKRKGYAQAFALGVTTNAVHGVHSFYDGSGNDVSLFFNDTRMTSSIAGGTATLLASTFTANQVWQCVDSKGYAYCAGSLRQGIIYTAGNTFAYLSGFTSTGTMVAVTTERLVQAGFSDSPNEIHFSSANDFFSWTVGGDAVDPIEFEITTPGAKITHITLAHKKIYWFKESSFGYILEGAELIDWKPVVVSYDIGTLDNTSTQDTDGNLYFRGQDGHVYMTDGAGLVKLSRDIDDTILQSLPRRTNSLTLTEASDWTAGTFSSPATYIDTVTVSGNIQSLFPDNFTSFRDGNNSTKQVWAATGIRSAGSAGSVGASVSSGKLAIYRYGGGDSGYHAGVKTANLLPITYTGTTVHFRIESLPYVGASLGSLEIRIASHSYSASGFNEGRSARINLWPTTSSTAAYVTDFGNQGSDDEVTNSIAGNIPFDFDFWVSSGMYSISIDNVIKQQGTWAATELAKTNYVYLFYNGSYITPSTATLDNFNVTPQTFTFTTAGQTTSSAITAWDTFSTSKNEEGGSIAFALRQSNTSTYTAVTSGGLPAFNPSSYWQVNSTFTVSFASAASPVSLSSITQDWFDGSSTETYSAFHDDKIYFSVTGSGATTNNRTLVFDLPTQGWTLYDLPSNGFYKRNNSLYFGSSNGGYIYKFGDTDNDAGAAINAYWKSKDFLSELPFAEKEYVNLSMYAGVEQSTMTVTYTVDGSSATAYTVPLYKQNTSFIRSNKNIPAGRVGGTFNVKFGNAAVDQPFEIFALGFGFRPKTWRPE